jgi:hypothetical protein
VPIDDDRTFRRKDDPVIERSSALLLGVSVTACLTVPLTFQPHSLQWMAVAGLAGVALWATALGLSKAGLFGVDWRSIPTCAGLFNFVVRLSEEARWDALIVMGAATLLFAAIKFGTTPAGRRLGHALANLICTVATAGQRLGHALANLIYATAAISLPEVAYWQNETSHIDYSYAGAFDKRGVL